MLKKGTLKSILTFVLVLTMTFGMFGTSVQAAGITAAEKTAVKRDNETYEVKIQVPGRDGSNQHDEVILMVDGSYSMDNEWPAMKEAINTIGRTVLNGSGNTQLTLMAFGMGDNEVLVHVKDANELAAALGELPGNLLYGRSSTNCEAGFTGVAEYIENHDETLKDVNVIFISDGNVNTDETPRAFDANWKTFSTKFGPLTVAQAAFEGTLTYGENLPAAFATVFGDRFADAADATEILERAFGGEVTDDEFLRFADQVWADVYAYSGLTPGAEYPVSDAERAFVKYDKENGTYIQDAFYYSTYKSSYVTYPNGTTRAAAAADALAAMTEVKSMYVVDYDSYSKWMDIGITCDKSVFVKSNGIAGLCDALADALTDLAKTPFNDVVVTDYMSKWVNLDPTSVRIVDNITGEVIWTVTEGWKINENKPTAAEPPVRVELVTREGYAAGGNDVIGNNSGDIYKLIWNVKDGALLRSDSYALVYDVTVDVEEEGFVLEQLYPANGNTYMEYKDENDEEQEEDIKVPLIAYTERIINLTKSTVINNADGTSATYPLEGIQFDIYYVCTVDEYTANIVALETPGMAVVAGKTPVATLTTDISGKATYNLTKDGQPDGVYMIVEKEHPAIVKPLDPFYVTVPMTQADGSGLDYVVDIEPKNELIIPDIKKDVTEINNDLDTVSAGEEFTWIVRGDVPADIADAKYYEITDTLDYRLTYAGNLVVKVEKVDAAADNSVSSGDVLTAGTDYTLSVNDKSVDVSGGDAEATKEIIVTLTDVGLDKVAGLVGEDSEEYEIRVYFNTIIDEDAAMGEEIPNQAALKYTNSTNFEFEVDSDIPKVYTCGININKFDAKDTSVVLAGAEFLVARKATAEEIADETIATETLVIRKGKVEEVVFVSFYDNAALTGERVKTVTTDANGKAVIYGLEEDSYYLVETKAPAGYNLLSYPKEIELNKTSHLDVNAVGVANSNAFELPTTGGIGTTIFTLAGAALIVGSGVALVGKKRKEEE